MLWNSLSSSVAEGIFAFSDLREYVLFISRPYWFALDLISSPFFQF